MNSFTLFGVGNLGRNPEAIAMGNSAYVRFCLIGNDYAGEDEGGRAHDIVTTAWFVALGKIGDDIMRKARKGDQLIVEARISYRQRTKRNGETHVETVFIVTGFRYGAKKRGPGSSAPSVIELPTSPCQPAAESVTVVAS